MKRGNTALKRVVSVASVAAMAIAGAVVAAPAASAAPSAGDVVRVIPVADAVWVDANGAIQDAATAGTYDGTAHATNAPTLLTYNQSFQNVRGLQIALPAAGGAAPAWSGQTVTVALDGGDATFAAAPSKVSIAKDAVDADDFDTTAGVISTHGTNFLSAGDTLNSTTITKSGAGLGLSSDKTAYTFQLPTVTATGTAGNVYVVTVDGISVSVPKDYDAAADSAVVTASVDVNGTASGTTTLGVVNNYLVTSDGDTVATSGNVTLPKITVGESVKQAFADGGDSVTLSISATPITGGTITPDFSKAKVSANNSSLDVDADATGGVITVNAANDTRVESFTVSGITVSGVKDGSDVTVSVVAPAATNSTNVKGDGVTASAVSFVADLETLASVKLTPTTALPRLAGSNRYDTAAQIAEKLGANNTVVIANGENNKQGIDALASNYLAGAADAPILLTQANTLPKETKDALTSLFKDSGEDIVVYVMGKTDSVSQSVRDEIESTIKATINTAGSVKIEEIAGSDRYETSAKAALEGDDVDGIKQYDPT